MGEITSIKGHKKDPCLYCGRDPHPTPLACPRIHELLISDEGNISGLVFVDDFFDDDEPPAAA